MKRSSQFKQGRRNGIKWAVTLLHRRAAQMNDPHARIVLNCAADIMGCRGKWGEGAKLKEEAKRAKRRGRNSVTPKTPD